MVETQKTKSETSTSSKIFQKPCFTARLFGNFLSSKLTLKGTMKNKNKKEVLMKNTETLVGIGLVIILLLSMLVNVN